MGIKRHRPEEIVSKQRQVEVLVGQGMARIDALRQISIAEQTYYRWRKHSDPGNTFLNHFLAIFFFVKDCGKTQVNFPAAGTLVRLLEILRALLQYVTYWLNITVPVHHGDQKEPPHSPFMSLNTYNSMLLKPRNNSVGCRSGTLVRQQKIPLNGTSS